MLELMAEGDARFEVDAIEVEREYLSRWTRSQSMRDGSLILSALLGADAFALLDQWRDAERSSASRTSSS